jgi:hypothetical protein
MFKGFVKGAVARVAFVAAAVTAPLAAHAQASGTSAIDYSSLTGSIDFSSTVTAVLAVAAALVTLYVAIKGAKIVLRMIRGA